MAFQRIYKYTIENLNLVLYRKIMQIKCIFKDKACKINFLINL